MRPVHGAAAWGQRHLVLSSFILVCVVVAAWIIMVFAAPSPSRFLNAGEIIRINVDDPGVLGFPTTHVKTITDRPTIAGIVTALDKMQTQQQAYAAAKKLYPDLPGGPAAVAATCDEANKPTWLLSFISKQGQRLQVTYNLDCHTADIRGYPPLQPGPASDNISLLLGYP